MKRLVNWMMAALLALAAGMVSAADVPLGAGDVVKISVYGNPDLGLETRVSEAGQITFPLVGAVDVGGLSASAAEKKLGSLLESGGYLRKAQVNIIVTSLQSQQASVLGQVNRPGRYPLEGRRTVMDMLAMAGGMTPDGADQITLIRKRGGATTRDVIDILDIVRNGDLKGDMDVAGNDIIYVERAPRFYIYGEVQRPGAFRLERNMTVVQALSVGGGLTQRGTERGVRIKRRNAAGQIDVIQAKHDDLLLVDDVVYVQEALF